MEVRVDEHGEILVRGENVAKAYRREDKAHAVAENDGWFRTGDLAETDEKGQLYFKGRKKNVIVTASGMNVYPEDLEKVVRQQLGVRDCVVIGLERDGNAEPCAVLLMDGPNSNAESAVQIANRSLAEYQQIRHWFPWPDADFPRTPTLKPLLAPIREFVSAKTGVSSASDGGEGVVAALITKITGRHVASGSRDAGLEADLKLTSLDRVELMSALEDRYQTELNEVRFSESGSIAQLEKLLTGDSLVVC